MEIFSFLNSESFGNYVLVAAAIGFVVAHIAALTPNKTDNKWVAWGLKIVDLVTANYGSRTNADPKLVEDIDTLKKLNKTMATRLTKVDTPAKK